jgi:hypothetical protein
VSDIDPSEITVVGRRPLSEKFNPDLADVPPVGGAHAKAEREGLPPGYRMRADAHYVDQLSRRSERDASRGSSALDEGDAVADGRERRGERLLAQVSEDVAAIGAAATLLTDGSALARRLSVDLIRAQAWRASWLLRAHAMLEGGARGHARPRPLGALLEQLRQGLSPECRLAGVTLHIQASDWNTSVAVDEAAIIAGVTGAVVATLGVLGHVEGAVVRIAVDASGGELRAIEVAQDEVAASPALGLRFFDASWSDRPGGFAAMIGALSARAAGQQHGGGATLLMGDRRGTTVRLALTRTH